MEEPRDIGPHTESHDHIAQLTDRGVGQHAFNVILSHGDRGAQHRRDPPDVGDHHQRVGSEDREHPGDHIHAGRHHRGSVDQGTHRRWAFHGVGEPDVKRELRRLAHRAAEQTEPGDRKERPAHLSFGDALEDAVVTEHAQLGEQDHDPDEEAQVPHPVYQEGLLARRRRCRFLVPEPDQQIGAQPHQLPEHVEQEKVVYDDQAEHGEGEQRQEAEEPGVARIARHIPHGIQVHQPADHGHHHQHDDGDVVHQQAHRDRHEVEIQPDPAVEGQPEIGIVGREGLNQEAQRKQEGDADGRQRDPIPPTRKALAEKGLDGVGDQWKNRDQQNVQMHFPPKRFRSCRTTHRSGRKRVTCSMSPVDPRSPSDGSDRC